MTISAWIVGVASLRVSSVIFTTVINTIEKKLLIV